MEGKLILEPEDLIFRPDAHEFLKDPRNRNEAILLPQQIPVAPVVYDSRETYTDEYLIEVLSGMMDLIRRDIQAIEDILEGKTYITVTDDGRIQRGPPGGLVDQELTMRDFGPQVETRWRGIGLSYLVGTSWNIDHVRDRPDLARFLEIKDQHPMKPEKLAKFTYDIPDRASFGIGEGPRAPTWYRHNTPGNLIPILVARSFAMQVNNVYFK